MYGTLLFAALAFYGAGTLMTVPVVIRRRPVLSPASLGALGLGLLLHVTAMAVHAIEIHRLPLTDVRSALSFFSILSAIAFFLVYLRYRIISLGLFVFPLVFTLTFIAALQPGHSFDSPSFRSGWLLVHIVTILLGYAGFFLTFVAAIMYLIQEKQLKSKRPSGLYYRLPSLEICDKLYYRSLLFGLPMLSVGLLMGFVWASRTWHGPWELDPKILAALITWVIYLILFATRASGGWSGRRSSYLAILGFALVMVTFLGISFVSGQHGYFPNLSNMP